MATPPYERRSVRTIGTKVETREVGGVARPHITGCAAVYNQISEDLGSDETGPIFEVVRPGAFDKALFGADGPEADVRALLNHEPSDLLGRLKAGTLKLRNDPAGLMYEIDPPDTQCARDLATSIGRGDLDGSSFGFVILRDPVDDDARGISAPRAPRSPPVRRLARHLSGLCGDRPPGPRRRPPFATGPPSGRGDSRPRPRPGGPTWPCSDSTLQGD